MQARSLLSRLHTAAIKHMEFTDNNIRQFEFYPEKNESLYKLHAEISELHIGIVAYPAFSLQCIVVDQLPDEFCRRVIALHDDPTLKAQDVFASVGRVPPFPNGSVNTATIAATVMPAISVYQSAVPFFNSLPELPSGTVQPSCTTISIPVPSSMVTTYVPLETATVQPVIEPEVMELDTASFSPANVAIHSPAPLSESASSDTTTDGGEEINIDDFPHLDISYLATVTSSTPRP